MVKEAARKCSCCGHNGHNSRTCSNKGCIKLFGAIIEKNEHTMKRSASMDNLETLDDNNIAHHHVEAGYNSDGDVGKPWTEAEHRTFLAGLNELGKGDWRGISKNFVTTRSPSQVASHAQKYFMRQAASPDQKKRRSSLFDMTFKEPDLVPAPKLPFIRTSGSISQASSSSVSPLKDAGDISAQANQLINRFPSLCLDNPHMLSPPTLAAGVPNYNPYMQGVPAMMAAPFVSMMNHSRVGYSPYVPRSPTSLAACAPFTAHPSGIQSLRSFPHTFVPESSAAKKEDALEQKIGQPPPQSTQGANLSSPCSGAISVI